MSSDPYEGVIWFRMKQLTRYTSLSESTIRDFIRDGVGPPAKVLRENAKRKVFLFRRDDVDEWMRNLRDAESCDV